MVLCLDHGIIYLSEYDSRLLRLCRAHLGPARRIQPAVPAPSNSGLQTAPRCEILGFLSQVRLSRPCTPICLPQRLRFWPSTPPLSAALLRTRHSSSCPWMSIWCIAAMQVRDLHDRHGVSQPVRHDRGSVCRREHQFSTPAMSSTTRRMASISTSTDCSGPQNLPTSGSPAASAS